MRINYFYNRTPITAATFAAEAIRTFAAEEAFRAWRESVDAIDDYSDGYYRAQKAEEA